jgi:hypothetical protein
MSPRWLSADSTPVRLSVPLASDVDLSPALALSHVAVHPAPSRALLARVLLLEGLIALESGAELPELPTESQRLSVSAPRWLDQWVYEIACDRRASMASIASRCVALGLAQLNSTH